MGRQCREWPEGAVNAEVESLIEEESRPGDAVIFTDGSVLRGTKSGWGYSARVNGQNVKEDSGAFQLTTSSMDMEVKAITQALRWLSTSIYKRAVVVTDSMSTLTKIQKGFLYSDWIKTITDSQIEKEIMDLLPWTCLCERKRESRSTRWGSLGTGLYDSRPPYSPQLGQRDDRKQK